MNTHPETETVMVPEVDPASLAPCMAAQEPTVAPDAVAAPEPLAALPPEQALKALPAALAAHIESLISEADTQGYLRGRNEAIEATQHFDPHSDDAPAETAFPRYARRSIWD